MRLKRIWGGPDQRGDLKAYTNRLRGKLGDDGRRPRYIETRRGEGYRLTTRRPRAPAITDANVLTIC
jgi:DNA-binding response OmpR family regulator